MAWFLPVLITRAAGEGMADSGIAIPAISHEHFLPAMGSQFPFPESAEIPVVNVRGGCVVLMERVEAIGEPQGYARR